MRRMTALLIILATLPLSAVALAHPTPNANLEKVELSRINSVLNSIYPMIRTAKIFKDPKSRVQFQYGKLKADIEAIQSGIAQKINSSPIVPRVVKPLASETHIAGGTHERIQ